MWHISGQMIARNLTLSMAGAVLLAGCDSNKIPELSIVSTSNGIPQVKITTSREKLESRAKEMLTKLQREFDLLASVKLPAIQTKGRELSEVISQINRDIEGACPDGMAVKLALIHRDIPSDRAQIPIDSVQFVTYEFTCAP
jgi:hypothetical protein